MPRKVIASTYLSVDGYLDEPGQWPPRRSASSSETTAGTKRLFTTVPRRTLTLVDTGAFPTGVIVNTYHPAPSSTAGQ